MRVIIIGGGASGLMAAIAAAEEGADVTVLERLDRVGKKILATGNGRCNITNINASETNYYGNDTKVIKEIFGRFGVRETLDFFESIGVMTKEESDGRIYPYTDQASSVLDALRLKMDILGVKVICGFEVKKIEKMQNCFEVISYSEEKISADKVVVACGGRSSPSLGSNGSGYSILKGIGHSVTLLVPSLVQIETEAGSVKGLKGIKKNCSIKILYGKKVLAQESGEVLFTEYGLSGPPVFSLSSKLPKENNNDIVFRLDVMEEYSFEDLVNMISMRKSVMGEYRLEDFFVGFLNKRIIYSILKSVGIMPLSRKGGSLSDKEIYSIAGKIKNWDFKFISTHGWNNSQVTKGGIPINEVDNDMQSLKMRGVYITGELLDIDGGCGGYNLQWAWSTGYIAGKAINKTKRRAMR